MHVTFLMMFNVGCEDITYFIVLMFSAGSNCHVADSVPGGTTTTRREQHG